jgi:hypothetical protein
MTSKFWLYLGIILACSGIGTGLGIFLIILYVWGDIRGAIDNNNIQNTTFEEEHTSMDHYDDETLDELK